MHRNSMECWGQVCPALRAGLLAYIVRNKYTPKLSFEIPNNVNNNINNENNGINKENNSYQNQKDRHSCSPGNSKSFSVEFFTDSIAWNHFP